MIQDLVIADEVIEDLREVQSECEIPDKVFWTIIKRLNEKKKENPALGDIDIINAATHAMEIYDPRGLAPEPKTGYKTTQEAIDISIDKQLSYDEDEDDYDDSYDDGFGGKAR